MSTTSLLTDEQWARIEPLLPPVKGAMGKPMRPHRPVVEGAIYRLKAGIAWRYLPAQFGAWQTVHRRHQRWSLDGTWDRVLAALQAEADAAGELDWRVSVDSTASRVHQHGATAARCPSGPSSHTGGSVESQDPGLRRDEPDDHAIGRSRDGLTTKTHALVDGKGRPLTIVVSPGQAGDSPVLPLLLAELRVARPGAGRPRTTPTALRGDKAYSSRGHRQLLRRRGITAVIPEPADQTGHRKRAGSNGGRPVGCDVEDYKERNVVALLQSDQELARGWPAATTRHVLVFRGGVVLAAVLDWLRRLRRHGPAG